MTDNEIKEDCLQEAGIDLGRYSHTELTEIKDALRRYHNTKLKLLSIADVSGSLPIAVASIRSNFESWRKGEINDGAFSWHLQNNLLRIEKELGWSFKGNDR
jgi:hypothetical protein